MRSQRPPFARLKRPNGELVEPQPPIKPVIIRVKEWDEAALSALLDRVGHPEVHRIPELNLLRLEPPADTSDEDYKTLLDTLRADPLVVHAYVLDPSKIIGRPHGNVIRTVGTNDPGIWSQYGLLRHDFFGAWRYTKGAGGKIGISDSGTTPTADADIRNPDFGRSYAGVTGADNFALTMDAAWSWDGGFESHGMMSSTEIALERSGNGINGSAAAPECTMYFGQMVNSAGWWDPYVAMSHHVWMANNGCKAINTSWGYVVQHDDMGTATFGVTVPQLISDFQASFLYCESHGCICINAINDYAINMSNPSDFHHIWSNVDMELPEQKGPYNDRMPNVYNCTGIGAMGDMYAPLCRGGWGPLVDFVAAGEEVWLMAVLSEQGAVGFGAGYGTSFAAPLVTAAVALMASVNSNLSAQDIIDILRASADDFRIETTPEFYLNMPCFTLNGPVVVAQAPSNNMGLLWAKGVFGLQPVTYSSAAGAGDGGSWGPVASEELDGSYRTGLNTTGRWTEAPFISQAQSHSLHPQTYLVPNAKVLNACKAVLMALSRANPGNVYPYVQAWGPGHFWRTTGNAYYDGFRSKMHTYNASAGTITTTLDGNVALEVRGFSTDPITSVELWLGGTRVYSGPGGVLRCAAVSAGNPQPFTVVAHTASGSTSDTLTDFVVDQLVVLDDFPMYQSWYDLRQDATFSLVPTYGIQFGPALGLTSNSSYVGPVYGDITFASAFGLLSDAGGPVFADLALTPLVFMDYDGWFSTPQTPSDYKLFVNYRTAPLRVTPPEPFRITGGLALLTEAPADPSSYPVTVIVNGQLRTRVTNWPQAGQYRILTQTISTGMEYLPVLQFSQADEGAIGTCDYYGTGTILSAQFFSMFISFMTPIVNANDVDSLPPATLDQSRRGRKGDVAYTLDGTGYFSDGVEWVPFLVQSSSNMLVNIGMAIATALDAGYVGPSFFDFIDPFSTTYGVQSDASLGLFADTALSQSLGITLDALFFFLGDPANYAVAFSFAVDAVITAATGAQTFSSAHDILLDALLDWAASPSSYATAYAFSIDSSYVLLTSPPDLATAFTIAFDSGLDYAVAPSNFTASLGMTEDAALDWAGAPASFAAGLTVTEDGTFDFAVAIANLAATLGLAEDGAYNDGAALPNLASTFGLSEDAALDWAASLSLAKTLGLTEDAVWTIDWPASLPNLASTYGLTEDGTWSSSLISLVNTGAQTSGGASANLTLPLPAGIAANDILIAVMIQALGNWTPGAAPSGWTLMPRGGASRLAVYWARATGSDTNPTFTGFNATWGGRGFISAFRSCFSVLTPVDVSNAAYANAYFSVNVPSITTNVDQDFLLVAGSFEASTGYSQFGTWIGAAPSQTPNSVSVWNDASGLSAFALWSGVKSPAGAVGTVTVSGGSNAETSIETDAVVIALRPTTGHDSDYLWSGNLSLPAASLGLTSDFVWNDLGSLSLAFTNALTEGGNYSAPAATAVSDNFNRADNTTLGSNWTAVTGLTMPYIRSNQLGGANLGQVLGARWSANTFNNNQYSEIKLNALPAPSATTNVGPAVRMSASANTCYYLAVSGLDDGDGGLTGYGIAVYRYVNGSISGVPINTGIAVITDLVWRLEVNGTTITVKSAASHGGTYTTQATATDSAISSGYAGVQGGNGTGAISVCDDWYGGDL